MTVEAFIHYESFNTAAITNTHKFILATCFVLKKSLKYIVNLVYTAFRFDVI